MTPPLDSPPARCRECNAEITSAEAHGLCPKCLLRRGLASEGETVILDSSAGPVESASIFPFDFGGYRVWRLLGEGGMGTVYEAEQLESGRRVALKVLGHSLDSPEARQRFLREGRLAASINHPNSVYIFGTEEIDGTPVIAMELVAGGTLHERVAEVGPLKVAEAVDTILQIIHGLEAAAALGVLHRDIKPSNCFIDSDGTVKIGDFGLSISTFSRADSLLTKAGVVMGTPAYSSPEQLRGETLDVRSDIYSVGVTLYFLLTGRAPFEGENMVALLANVLDKPPPSPREFRREIPKPLARLLLRCLAKPAGDRFKNYDELRQALLPFNSMAPTPATLGLRVVAAIIDSLAISLLIMLVWLVEMIAKGSSLYRPWQDIAMQVFSLAYFSIPEGLWGASLGKALVGLRVARLDRSAPGIPKALLRTIAYQLAGLIALLPDPTGTRGSLAWVPGWVIANVLFYVALFSTARRWNGFAGLHDLLTKTRVIQKSAYQRRTAVTQDLEEPVPSTDALPQLGPYHVLATLATSESDEILLGYDTTLLRRVWIRKTRGKEALVVAAAPSAARPSRLRWLQGNRSDEESWDAYEAVSGAPLMNLVKTQQPWKSVRHWLLDLTEELAAAARDGSVPATLELERVWITTESRAKLLDFPAPGAESTAEPVPGTEPALFLNQLGISALEGRLATGEEARSRAPQAPLPLAARGFFRKLSDGADFTSLTADIRSFVHNRPSVSRRRRLGLIVVIVGLVFFTFGPLVLSLMLLPIGRSLPMSAFYFYVLDGLLVAPAILSLLCAVAFRGGPLLRMLGIAIVTRDGSDASRLRMLWRSFVAWSPWLLGLTAPVLAVAMGADSLISMASMGLLVAGVVVWSALLRERGLQDRIAGTWLVPR